MMMMMHGWHSGRAGTQSASQDDCFQFIRLWPYCEALKPICSVVHAGSPGDDHIHPDGRSRNAQDSHQHQCHAQAVAVQQHRAGQGPQAGKGIAVVHYIYTTHCARSAPLRAPLARACALSPNTYMCWMVRCAHTIGGVAPSTGPSLPLLCT